MPKLVNKSTCYFDNGYICCKDGEILGPALPVFEQLRSLEYMLQKVRYLDAQPEACPPPSLDGFEFVSERAKKIPRFEPFETPNIDKAVEAGIGIRDEIKGMQITKAANKWIDEHPEVFEFVANDRFVPSPFVSNPFDLHLLGNPLELTVEDLMNVVGEIFASKHVDLVMRDAFYCGWIPTGDFDGDR